MMLERYLGNGKEGEFINQGRLDDCVNVILSYQNKTGGWATYENTRSFPQLELINPAETFGDIVIDYDYVECSSACLTAIVAFIERHEKKRSGSDGGGGGSKWASRFSTAHLEAALALTPTRRRQRHLASQWQVKVLEAERFICENFNVVTEVGEQ